MPDLIINSITYSGTPTSPAQPFRIDADGGIERETIGGVLLEAADNTANLMLRAFKSKWTLKWSKCNNTTRAAVRALSVLTTTLPFTDQLGVAYTCIVVPGSFRETTAANQPTNAILYNVSIALREA
jgi:hypothetical protein